MIFYWVCSDCLWRYLHSNRVDFILIRLTVGQTGYMFLQLGVCHSQIFPIYFILCVLLVVWKFLLTFLSHQIQSNLLCNFLYSFVACLYLYWYLYWRLKLYTWLRHALSLLTNVCLDHFWNLYGVEILTDVCNITTIMQCSSLILGDKKFVFCG